MGSGKWKVGPLALVALLAGCGGESQTGEGGPTVVLRDSVVLQESDSAFLADVGLIDVDEAGSMLVTDDSHKRVTLYAADGELRGSYGTRGEGPGEFLLLGVPLFVGDSLVAVADNRRRVINVYGRGSTEFLRQVASPGVVYDGVTRGDVTWLGALDRRTGTGVARWDRSADSITRLVPMPALYGTSQRWAGMNTIVSVDEWRDTLFVGFSGDDALLVADLRGTIVQRIVVPRRLRRGVPADVLQQIETGPPGGGFDKYSALLSLHRLSDGRMALVHFDRTMAPSGAFETVYVSVLSPDRTRACVDGVVPVHRQTLPAVRWKGDNLVVVEQVVVGSTRAINIARTFELQLDECAWMPVQQARRLQETSALAPARPTECLTSLSRRFNSVHAVAVTQLVFTAGTDGTARWSCRR